MSKNTFFHLECGSEDRFSLTYGPFEFVQLTYDSLRVGPDGDEVGYFKDGFWYFHPNIESLSGKNIFGGTPGTKDDRYSDVVIFGS